MKNKFLLIGFTLVIIYPIATGLSTILYVLATDLVNGFDMVGFDNASTFHSCIAYYFGALFMVILPVTATVLFIKHYICEKPISAKLENIGEIAGRIFIGQTMWTVCYAITSVRQNYSDGTPIINTHELSGVIICSLFFILWTVALPIIMKQIDDRETSGNQKTLLHS